MQTENIFIIHPMNIEQENALKAFAKALKIKIEVTTKTMYNPDFVEKIQRSKKEFEDGEFIQVGKENLQQFLGLK